MGTGTREPQSGRGRSAGLRSERRTLAVMLLLASLGAFLGAVAPMSPQAPVVLDAALSATGVALAALVLRTRSRAVLHLGTAAVVGGVTAVVAAAATPAGATGTAIGYLWVPLYAAFFHPRGLARAHVVAVAASLAWALSVNPFQGAVHVWVLVVLTSAAATEVVGTLVATLREHALTDPLTGLLNRDGLHRAAERLTRQTGGRGAPLTLAVIDLDGFKSVNDTQGHEAGDRLLVRLARGWDEALRDHDVAARLGGDEFVLLLPGTDVAGARATLARLRAVTPGTSWSVGLVDYPPGAPLSQVLREADRRLYAAKRDRAPVAVLPAQRRSSDALVARPA